MLVGAVSGTAPTELKGVFRSALEKIHETLYAELDTFQQGALSVFEPATPYLQACLLGQAAPQKRRRIVPWLVLAGIILLVASLVYFQVRNQSRWNSYFETLKREPGIVVTRIEKHGGGWTVAGLKDPKAPDPARLLAGLRLDPAKVAYEWQPYLSLNTPFSAERDLDADRDRIEKPIVRFELGKSTLPLAEASRIEAVAEAIERLLQVRPDSRITVVGRTDEVGTPEANTKLSAERATQVRAALEAQGVPAERMDVVGLGNPNPEQTPLSDWDRSAHRSVTFKLTAAK